MEGYSRCKVLARVNLVIKWDIVKEGIGTSLYGGG